MSSLRGYFSRQRGPAGPSLPPGYLLYAIGDIHGRDDLLGELLAKVATDSEARPAAQRIIVFLGDLIDRGPQSSQVVERLRTWRPAGTRLVFLTGNHEEVLLRVLAGESALVGDWLRFGGRECLASYGLDAARLRRMAPARAVELVRDVIPPAHADFLRSFDDSFRAGDYLFAHAGIRPGIPLAEQARIDLRWIREPFLSSAEDHGFVVVHGHTIRTQVEERANRIGIDTGAYRSGILTAIGLHGEDRWYIQASAAGELTSATRGNQLVSSALDAVSSQSG